MIREIVKDPVFLQQKSAPASEADVPVGLTCWIPSTPIERPAWALPPI